MKIGIDAGGTKTKAVLYKNEKIVDEFTGNMGNPIVNFELAVSNVIKTIEILSHNNHIQYSDISLISIGMAGASTVLHKLQNSFKGVLPCKFLVDSDLKMSHIATFKNGDGNLLIAGTGSSLLSRVNGNFIQKGGWGHIIGDEGSGYWLGKQIIKSYVDFLDYKEAPLDFEELIPALNTIFPDRASIIEAVYSKPKTEIARLASLCTEYRHNKFLNNISKQAGKDLSKMILSSNKSQDLLVALEGSVIKHNTTVRESCLSELKSNLYTVQITHARPATESVFYL